MATRILILSSILLTWFAFTTPVSNVFAQDDVTISKSAEGDVADDTALDDEEYVEGDEVSKPMSPMVLILILLTLVLMLHGMPLFGALGALGLLLTYHTVGAEDSTQMWVNFSHPFTSLTESEVLLPVPLFTIVGFVLAGSKAPERIVVVFRWIIEKTLGKMAAAFGILALIVSAFFTPLTGASGVTIIALGGLLFPILARQKYPEKLNLGIISSSGSLGLLFFPSLPVIIYGIINETNIKSLFKAGIVPGIILILIPSLWVLWSTRKLSTSGERVRFEEVKPHLKKFGLELIILPILFALFLTGKIVISEMGALTLVWYFVLEVIVFKEINRKKLFDLFEESMSLLGGILIIIFFASAFTQYLIDQQIAESLFNAIKPYVESKWSFLIALNIFLLIVGSLMDIFSAIIVVAPLVLGLAKNYDIDPVHLGILFLTNLEIGYLTPPVGINLFIASFRFKKPLVEVYYSIIPFLVSLLIAQILITYIPALSLWWQYLGW